MGLARKSYLAVIAAGVLLLYKAMQWIDIGEYVLLMLCVLSKFRVTAIYDYFLFWYTIFKGTSFLVDILYFCNDLHFEVKLNFLLFFMFFIVLLHFVRNVHNLFSLLPFL